MFEEMVRRNEEWKAAKTPPPKSEPLAVVPSGLPIAEAVALLQDLQAKYLDAEVRSGERIDGSCGQPPTHLAAIRYMRSNDRHPGVDFVRYRQ
jgi:hypothetical protein